MKTPKEERIKRLATNSARVSASSKRTYFELKRVRT